MDGWEKASIDLSPEEADAGHEQQREAVGNPTNPFATIQNRCIHIHIVKHN